MNFINLFKYLIIYIVLNRLFAEFGKTRGMTKRRERNDFSNAIDSKDNLWNSVSLENDTSCEELTLTDLKKLKNRDGLQSKTSCNFDSEREEKSAGTRRKNDRENLSQKISTKSAKYQTSKSDTMKGKAKILRSNTLNASSPRIKSAKTPIDGRCSNMNSRGKSKLSDRFLLCQLLSAIKFDIAPADVSAMTIFEFQCSYQTSHAFFF